MRITTDRQESRIGISAPKVGKAALTALNYTVRAGFLAASFYSFIAAGDIARDFRILDGALPIESWRPPLSQSELAWGVPIWGALLAGTAYADYVGREELAKGHRFTPAEVFVNKHAGAIATGTLTGLFAAGTIGLVTGTILL